MLINTSNPLFIIEERTQYNTDVRTVDTPDDIYHVADSYALDMNRWGDNKEGSEAGRLIQEYREGRCVESALCLIGYRTSNLYYFTKQEAQNRLQGTPIWWLPELKKQIQRSS